MAVLYPYFLNSAGVSTFVTLLGSALSLLVTTLGAYVLSRKALPFRKFFFYLIIIPMYFSAGLIPWYLVMKDLGFVDSIWVMIFPPLISTFYRDNAELFRSSRPILRNRLKSMARMISRFYSISWCPWRPPSSRPSRCSTPWTAGTIGGWR